MNEKKIDPKNLDKLNNPDRLKDLPPYFLWNEIGLDFADTILDIGAGTGLFSVEFSPYAKRIYACDISEQMINWIDDNVCPHYDNIIPVKMDETSVPLDDNIADVVLMFNVYHELDEPSTMLAECRRLLKDGGKFCIADWKKENMPEGPPLNHRCMSSEVEAQIHTAGFTDIKTCEELEKHFLITARA